MASSSSSCDAAPCRPNCVLTSSVVCAMRGPILEPKYLEKALDALRRTKVRHDSIFEATGTVEASSATASTVGGPNELEQWLCLLTPDKRETIVLKIFDEFTFQQIADLRQVPLPTVASWYRRGLSKMKATLTTENHE